MKLILTKQFYISCSLAPILPLIDSLSELFSKIH